MQPILPILTAPAAVLLKYVFHAGPLPVFATSAVAIAVLANWIRRGTEQIAERVGPAVGGLLAISFGSIAKFVLALFVLADDRSDVVRAQLTGSLMATARLGLGLAALAGGLLREKQAFKRAQAGLLSSLLILAVIALMLLPAVFDPSGRTLTGGRGLAVSDEQLSLGISVVLLLL